MCFFFFFFNDTATTEIYTLSLHDALPIFLALGFLSMGVFEQFHAIAEQDNGAVFLRSVASLVGGIGFALVWLPLSEIKGIDRKSTRLNSSHVRISYAVFCLKKKKKKQYMS